MIIDNHYVAGRGVQAMSIIGTVLGGLGTLGGGLLGGQTRMGCPEDTYVTRYELNQAQTIAAKDSEIALLKSEANNEIKIADVYERLATKINTNQREQDAINRDQAVYNATNTATVSVLGSQVNDIRSVLNSITAVHIPAEKVCPTPMPKYNSWTAPTNAAVPAT